MENKTGADSRQQTTPSLHVEEDKNSVSGASDHSQIVVPKDNMENADPRHVRDRRNDLIQQLCRDLNQAHNEILRLQNVTENDFGKWDWPEWSPQASSIRWAERVLQGRLAKTTQWTLFPPLCRCPPNHCLLKPSQTTCSSRERPPLATQDTESGTWPALSVNTVESSVPHQPSTASSVNEGQSIPLTDRASSESQLSGLLPCPKGCKAEILIYRLPDSQSRHFYCEKCRWTTPWGDTDEEAQQEWNTRASDASKELHWLASVVYLHYHNRTDLDPVQQKHLELAMKAGAPFSQHSPQNQESEKMRTTPLLQKIVEICDAGSAAEFGDADERLRAIRGLIIGEAV